MSYAIDETHDVKLESWVESANDPKTDFPIQNLPLATMVRATDDSDDEDDYTLSAVVAIGDMLLDLNRLSMSDLAPEDDGDWDFIAVDEIVAEGKWSSLRKKVQKLLLKDNPALRDHPQVNDIVIPRDDSMLSMPFIDPIGDYTDFYASLYHATNVGCMFRPDNPLLPNYKHIPIGYHGRASSIVPSGTEIQRPVGQQAPSEDGGLPNFGPCKLLDYEMEMGAIIGRGNELGEPIDIADAEDHLLGLCILNDWSARDLQKWEYVPLGPFLAKNFASTISPYIVTMEALAPFRSPAQERDAGDPQPLAYMDSDANRKGGGFDIKVEVYLSSAKMREEGMEPVHLSTGNMKDLYWTIGQMVTHHTVNGCNLQPGDLLGSGTISGPTRDARGSMLELTWDGDPFANPPISVPGTQRTPLVLPTGEERKFLADGDEVIMKAYCERDGFRRIGFGECRGIITAARSV
ncbi:MAG: fumarylacetoacetase [Phycisphaerales bacterium]|nr:fumarylacetoacetase [Phycisphaerales bacterium]